MYSNNSDNSDNSGTYSLILRMILTPKKITQAGGRGANLGSFGFCLFSLTKANHSASAPLLENVLIKKINEAFRFTS